MPTRLHLPNDVVQNDASIKEKVTSGIFIISLILSFCFIVSVNHFMYTSKIKVSETTWLFSFIYLLTVAFPFTGYIVASKRSLSTYGVSNNNLKVSFKEGILFTLLLFAGVSITLMAMQFLGNAGDIEKWLYSGKLSAADAAYYLLHVVVQEFFIRGVIQTSLYRFFENYRSLLSIFCTSLIFGFLHIHNGYMLVLIAFLISFPMGYIFQKHKNLIGVIIIHWTLGLLIIYFWNTIITSSI